MSKIMLIDATQSEETRVAIVDGQRLEEFDFETAAKKQIKGNIYLARVTRVEPSLQAAFVEYGGNRHAFLPLSEIHPDYYRVPVSDREREHHRERAEAQDVPQVSAPLPEAAPEIVQEAAPENTPEPVSQEMPAETPVSEPAGEAPAAESSPEMSPAENAETSSAEAPGQENAEGQPAPAHEPVQQVEVLGGDDSDDMRRARRTQRRQYQIQEVIKRRQVMLIQVTKEERGNKGAAVTTYLSLAGRYCVLMPNTMDGGGVSRKISNPNDRRRMKDLISDLEIPDGMSVILRTAGIERSKTEIRRDLDYLLRLWDRIRELTLESMAPALVHEEGNLVKRAIRDLYQREMDAVEVAGDEAYKTAKEFMKMIIPSHARKVRLYKDEAQPLFARYHVEEQIDAIHNPVAQLPSGGSIVINSTEALVAIDVNSGRATRERHIEDTALKTNLEATEEIARQLRLRDLGGLVVIDFIDMEENRHNAAVERKMKEVMKNDRARIQIGRISPFGLLEMSRQRLRPSLIETHFESCPMCRGIGVVRSVEASALSVLRAIEKEGVEGRFGEIIIKAPAEVCFYLLNQKRAMLAGIETRYVMTVKLLPGEGIFRPDFQIERLQRRTPESRPQPPVSTTPPVEEIVEDEIVQEDEETGIEAESSTAPETSPKPKADEEGDNRRRRGRRGGRRRGQNGPRDGEPREPRVVEINAPQPDLPAGEAPLPERAPDGDRRRDRNRRDRNRRPPRRERPESGGAPATTTPAEAPAGPEVSPASPHVHHESAPHHAAPAEHAEKHEHAHAHSHKPPEKVNEVAGPPKQGWWKKLMG